MESRPISEGKRHLTQESFAAFLLWLSPDQGQAGVEYLEIRQTLVKYFVRKGCTHSEDLADRTLDRVASIVHREPDKYPTAISLCCAVARRVWLEYLREATPEPLEGDNLPARDTSNEDFTEMEMNCLGSCMSRLSAKDRELITQYHQFQGRQKIESRQAMAQMFGGLNKLRITTYRIRVRLHDCVSSCVQRSALN